MLNHSCGDTRQSLTRVVGVGARHFDVVLDLRLSAAGSNGSDAPEASSHKHTTVVTPTRIRQASGTPHHHSLHAPVAEVVSDHVRRRHRHGRRFICSAGVDAWGLQIADVGNGEVATPHPVLSVVAETQEDAVDDRRIRREPGMVHGGHCMTMGTRTRRLTGSRFETRSSHIARTGTPNTGRHNRP